RRRSRRSRRGSTGLSPRPRTPCARRREAAMAPRVLISDKLSPAAVQIFADRGVDATVKPGLDKDQLADIIGEFDGLAIRSATKVTAKLLDRAKQIKVVGPPRIWGHTLHH